MEVEEAHQSWAAEAAAAVLAMLVAPVVVADEPWWDVVGVVRAECVGGEKAKVTGRFRCEYQVTVV